MAERREVGFPKTNSGSLKEQLARTTLSNVRSQGHTYVELREDGRRFVFFCTLCLAPCYSDSVLLDHLKGNLHSERFSAAKITLFGPNPWPFNDGVLFFGNSNENEKCLPPPSGDQNRFLEFHNNDNNLSIVKYADAAHSCGKVNSRDKKLKQKGCNSDLVIPGVLIKDEISDLKVSFMGVGKVAARIWEKDGASNGIIRIWCEWLGKEEMVTEDKSKILKHDFAVVTFAYNCDLGRKGLLDDVKLLLTYGSPAESENVERTRKKRKKSFSDPEDVSESFSNQYSSGDDSSASNGGSSSLLIDQYDGQLLDTRFISSKNVRREVRRQQRLAAERMCDICQQKMLPGKDVGTLLNLKTGKLACSSRNGNGVFHVFHTSCLIHWILLCELEVSGHQLIGQKVRRRPRKRNGAKYSGLSKDGEINATGTQIYSVLCPECQGTGIIVEGDELEKPSVSLSQMFRCKIRASDARRAWMKSPELLDNCSTGFYFPSESDERAEDKVLPLKLLHFYGADKIESRASFLG